MKKAETEIYESEAIEFKPFMTVTYVVITTYINFIVYFFYIIIDGSPAVMETSVVS